MCRDARRWLARHGKRRRGWSLRTQTSASYCAMDSPRLDRKMEIFFPEPFDRPALRVAHHHPHHHQVAG